MLTIKQGDTRNAIVVRLKKNENYIDLTGCHIKFYMSGKIDGAYCTVLEDGRVMYPLEPYAVDTSGVFYAEFKVVYPDGRIDTFPNDRYMKINIVRDLS